MTDVIATEPAEGPPATTATELHRALDGWNRARLMPALPDDAYPLDLTRELALRARESAFVAAELAAVQHLADAAPRRADDFVAWFEGLREVGPGQNDALFPWLAEAANLAEMRWFLRQEIAGEAGFEDLLALTQVRFPRTAKLELARNFWDEMGRGDARAMHGPMLERLAVELDVRAVTAPVVWETLALGNLMVALAADRRSAYQSIGALGVIELTAPGRAEKVNRGLDRLGVGGAARTYYALHATLDKQHSAAWNREVVHSLVDDEPRVATAIAEGALMRLAAGARCFARYRAELWAAPAETPHHPTA